MMNDWLPYQDFWLYGIHVTHACLGSFLDDTAYCRARTEILIFLINSIVYSDRSMCVSAPNLNILIMTRWPLRIYDSSRQVFPT